MEDDKKKTGKSEIAEELRAIRDKLDKLEQRVDSLTNVKSTHEANFQTFVDGLDQALGGGIPVGHVILLAGPSGTMKTSLLLYTMLKNREQGLNGIFITLEERRESLIKTMARLGLGAEEDFIVDIGKLRIEHEDAEETRDWLQVLKDYLTRRLEKDRLDLVVIDPLNSLYSLAGIVNPRRDLFHFFSFLRNIGITTILVSEAETNDRFFPNHEDYLADGVLTLNFTENDTGELRIQLRCLKMRHSNHSRLNYHLSFVGGKFQLSAITGSES